MFKRKQQKNGPAHERIRKLSDEHREIVLNCLACRMRLQRIIEYLRDEYGVDVRQASISYYKRAYAGEIADRRRRHLENVTSLDLPFIQQADRLAEYSRQASIELNRSRLKESRECMRAIAEETGDLKQTNNVIFNPAEKSSAELLEIVDSAMASLKQAEQSDEPEPGHC